MSLEILKPPTDTLYKFLAILGLLFFISSLIAPVYLSKQIGEQQIEHLRDLELLMLDAKNKFAVSDRLREITEEQQESYKRLEKASYDFLNRDIGEREFKYILDGVRSASTKYYQQSPTYNDQLLEWNKESLQVEYKANLFKNSSRAARLLVNVSFLGLLAGLIMSIFGFILWYRRTQKFEDLILKKKAESEEP